MATVFINYRNGDGAWAAAGLDKLLSQRFGANEVFYSSRSIKVGQDAEAEMLSQARGCPILLAVIGKNWLTTSDSTGRRRIDLPDDWVRREIRESLRAGNCVIAVLIDQMELLRREQLPSEIADLAVRQYHRMSTRDLDADVERLVAKLLSIPQGAHLCVAGSESLGTWWRRWFRENPVFAPEVLLAGRTKAALELRALVSKRESVVRVGSDSIEESLAFAAAALVDQRDVRVVANQEALDQYLASTSALVLLVSFDDPQITGTRHCVVVPCCTELAEVRLYPAPLLEAASAFEDLGLSSEAAWSYAARMRGDFPALRLDLSRAGRRLSEESPEEVDRSVLASVVAKGPMRHLGLDTLESEAKRALADDPRRAAELYESIVGRLLAEGFVVPAIPLQVCHTNALRRAGQAERAARVALDMFWETANDGLDSFSTLLSALGRPDTTGPSALALHSLNVLRGYTVAIDRVATAFDSLTRDDPHRLAAAVLLSEHALAARRADVLAPRVEALSAIADVTWDPCSSRERLTVRLALCVAEVRDDWEWLRRRGRREFEQWCRPWITARRARSLAIVDQLQAAEGLYEEAVSEALSQGMNAEAAHWLHGLSFVRRRLGDCLAAGDQDEAQLIAHLRSMASPCRLPGGTALKEQALQSVSSGGWALALGRVTRWRWQSYVWASLSDEIDATVGLGDLLAANREPVDGLRDLVWAGARGRAVRVARSLPEQPLDWPVPLTRPTAAQRSAMLAVVATSGDLIPDAEACEWIEHALDVIRHPPSCAPADDLAGQAVSALASLAPCCTEEQAVHVLDLVGTWELRQRAALFVEIAERHGRLAERAVSCLVSGLARDDAEAEAFVAFGHRGRALLRTHPDAVADRLKSVRDNHWAFLALALAGRPTERVCAYVRELVTDILDSAADAQVPTVSAGHGDLPLVAPLLSVELRHRLVAVLLRRALDSADETWNRRTALEGVIALTPYVTGECRRELFAALGPMMIDESPRGDNIVPAAVGRSFSALKFLSGPRSLSDLATRACAGLTSSEEDRALVRDRAVRLLNGHRQIDTLMVVHSLAMTADHLGHLPAGHPDPLVHELAALFWTRQPDDPEVGLHLAHSPHRSVRQRLAECLDGRSEHSALREILVGDPSRSVRTRVRESSCGRS